MTLIIIIFDVVEVLDAVKLPGDPESLFVFLAIRQCALVEKQEMEGASYGRATFHSEADRSVLCMSGYLLIQG